MNNSLQGVRVLDLTRYMLGGYPTQLLADLGAEVIKIEDCANGDLCRGEAPFINGVSHYFAALCRNKKSVSLNLKHPEGLAIFNKLAAVSDVIIENFRPGVTRKLGVDYARMQALNPRLVYCSMSGFGQDDPRSLSALHDINLQALSGLTELNEGRVPPLSLCDIATGMNAAQGVALALFQRERTGCGQHVDVPMFDSLVWWLSVVYSRGDVQGGISARALEYPSLSYCTLPTGDGHSLALGMVEEKFWRSFCEATGNDDLVPLHKARPHEAPEAYERLKTLAASKTRDEWLAWLADKDLCIVPSRSPMEAVEALLASADDLMDRVNWPGLGPTLQTNLPLRFSRMAHPLAEASPPPVLGQHNAVVLASLGYSSGQIEQLAEAGAIGAV